MSRKDKSLELNLDLINRAVNGDDRAMEEILKYYDPYIISLVTFETIDEDGKIHKQVDEDMKMEVLYKLAEGIRKWQVLL